jgi:hypothetical protein
MPMLGNCDSYPLPSWPGLTRQVESSFATTRPNLVKNHVPHTLVININY